MATNKRAFRKPESFEAERLSRDAVAPFLRSRGFSVEDDHRKVAGTAVSQVVTAVDPSGKRIKMRVRLCWRWDAGEGRMSAAQLRARLIDDDWDKTLQAIVSRDNEEGISHALLLQRSDSEIVYAALISVSELRAIWWRQRDVSQELIESGVMGGVRKNHAANGGSPTLWLMDRRTPAAHAVPDVLWNWPGVVDIVKYPITVTTLEQLVDDTFDDIPGLDHATLGSDGAARTTVMRSHVKRDPRVRKEVIKRATSGCERVSCDDSRRYVGFLDVHHILGVETSDRVWNCVALCPSCHREAHFGPERDRLNDELLQFASKFKHEAARI